ncbi:hypothetical protein L596_014286 [Steinernema carpocapsae]|uniref:Asparagine synthetase domain-containing protein n=1 Tax=Steinernema carpocapsae TaxID=34508 RepID=A0A4U5NBH8_STECR|nr:hypothetical protein L596_014286 [Steinernema carpocapsae]
MILDPTFEFFSFNSPVAHPVSESFCYPLNKPPIYQGCDTINDYGIVCDILASGKGPFAYVYHRPDLNMIFIGRDGLGRCSLVVSVAEDRSKIVVGKYADEDKLIKMEPRAIPAGSIYIIDYNNGMYDRITMICAARQDESEPLLREFAFCRYITESAVMFPRINESEFIIDDVFKAEMKKEVTIGIVHFDQALKSVTYDIDRDDRPVGVLFSGGVDSLMVAIAAQRTLPSKFEIDLINVAFGDGEQTGQASLSESALISFQKILGVASESSQQRT